MQYKVYKWGALRVLSAIWSRPILGPISVQVLDTIPRKFLFPFTCKSQILGYFFKIYWLRVPLSLCAICSPSILEYTLGLKTKRPVSSPTRFYKGQGVDGQSKKRPTWGVWILRGLGQPCQTDRLLLADCTIKNYSMPF